MRALVARNLEGRGINMHPRTTLTEVRIHHHFDLNYVGKYLVLFDLSLGFTLTLLILYTNYYNFFPFWIEKLKSAC